jgi:hypothetical protein
MTRLALVVSLCGVQVAKAITLSVRPIRVRTISLTPNPVLGGNTVTGSVSLECAAAPENAVVTLSSSNTAAAVPTVTSITIPAGSTTGSFKVRTVHASVSKAPTIYATLYGVRKGAVLTINP